MNSHQINCFLTVAQYLSFSRAAEELFLAQSTVSRSVAQLEEEWGVSLFFRSGKSISLTQEGEEYVQLCRRYLNDFQRISDTHRARHESAALKLNYSIFPAWNISHLLYENADQLCRRHPNWSLSLRICPANQLIRELMLGSLDIVFHFGDMLSFHPEIATHNLLELPQVILYSAHSPLAAKEDISPEDFQDLPFLYVPDEVFTPETMERQSRFFERRYGFPLKIQSVENTDALSFALELGQGVALMDEWSRYRNSPHLRTFPIDLPLPVVLAWRRSNRSPAIQDFVNETAEYFRTTGHSS